MSHAPAPSRSCETASMIATARATLLRRVAADPRHTPEAIDWAAERLREDPSAVLGPDGVASPQATMLRLTHLAAQRAALDAACAAIASPRIHRGGALDVEMDDLQQSYVEYLDGLAAHPPWCCDEGRPTVTAARMNLAGRTKQRRIDRLRNEGRVMAVADIEPFTRTGRPDGHEAQELREVMAHLAPRLPKDDREKLGRLLLHVVCDQPHELIAENHGMTHDAVRQESVRLRHRVGPLLRAYYAD